MASQLCSSPLEEGDREAVVGVSSGRPTQGIPRAATPTTTLRAVLLPQGGGES